MIIQGVQRRVPPRRSDKEDSPDSTTRPKKRLLLRTRPNRTVKAIHRVEKAILWTPSPPRAPKDWKLGLQNKLEIGSKGPVSDYGVCPNIYHLGASIGGRHQARACFMGAPCLAMSVMFLHVPSIPLPKYSRQEFRFAMRALLRDFPRSIVSASELTRAFPIISFRSGKRACFCIVWERSKHAGSSGGCGARSSGIGWDTYGRGASGLGLPGLPQFEKGLLNVHKKMTSAASA